MKAKQGKGAQRWKSRGSIKKISMTCNVQVMSEHIKSTTPSLAHLLMAEGGSSLTCGGIFGRVIHRSSVLP